jgi:TonB family protein
VLHILVFTGAFVLFGLSTSRIVVPPHYRVTLVDLPPGDQVPVTTETQTPLPRPEPPKAAKQADKGRKAAPRKGGMPELKKSKAKPEREYVAEDVEPAPPKPAGKSTGTGTIALSAPQEFKFSPFVGIVREKIVRNWNPPPGAKETKATVVFRIGRTGRVTDANLQHPSGNFYFDQAAMRSILSSSPFPPLPEGYYQDAMEFSVDLMAGE